MTRKKSPVHATTMPSAIKFTWSKGPVPPLVQAQDALVRLAVEKSSSKAEAAARLGISEKQLERHLAASRKS